MKRKTIEASREVRLWIRDIVVPGVMLGTSLLAIPEVRDAAAAKAKQFKESIDKKFKKNESN